MFGILNIDKPQSYTSHDVVARIRKILNIKQVGHTGTLDPLATGVLPICVGKATKVIQYLDDTKAYRAHIKLGIVTDSYDTDGEVLEQNDVELDIEKIKHYLLDFKGQIEQVPPMHSAVHYKGKRLYEYARKNIKIEDIPKRSVFIKDIGLVEVIDKDTAHPTIVIDVDCSTGTYIRSIIHDLGIKLGYGATMSGLVRTRAGSFKITDSYTIENLQKLVEDGQANNIFTNPIEILPLKRVVINDTQLAKVKHGQFFKVHNINFETNEIIMLEFNQCLAAMAEVREGIIYPKTVFI